MKRYFCFLLLLLCLAGCAEHAQYPAPGAPGVPCGFDTMGDFYDEVQKNDARFQALKAMGFPALPDMEPTRITYYTDIGNVSIRYASEDGAGCVLECNLDEIGGHLPWDTFGWVSQGDGLYTPPEGRYGLVNCAIVKEDTLFYLQHWDGAEETALDFLRQLTFIPFQDMTLFPLGTALQEQELYTRFSNPTDFLTDLRSRYNGWYRNLWKNLRLPTLSQLPDPEITLYEQRSEVAIDYGSCTLYFRIEDIDRFDMSQWSGLEALGSNLYAIVPGRYLVVSGNTAILAVTEGLSEEEAIELLNSLSYEMP